MIKGLYAIACIDSKTNAIGYKNDLIYHIKEDMAYFKSHTINNTVICGRNTYNSFPLKPLPHRNMIVYTRNDIEDLGISFSSSKETILKIIKALCEKGEKCYIIGGEHVYNEFIDYCEKLYITEVENNKEIFYDTVFPKIDPKKWDLYVYGDWKNHTDKIKYRFKEYIKR